MSLFVFANDGSRARVDQGAQATTACLVGRWLLACRSHGENGCSLENDVSGTSIWSSSAAESCNGVSNDGGRTRMPSARAGGVLNAVAGVPPAPPLKGTHEAWGFSARVIPHFPSDISSYSAHPWLRQRFESFLSLVLGEEGQAQIVNAQLVRYARSCASW